MATGQDGGAGKPEGTVGVVYVLSEDGESLVPLGGMLVPTLVKICDGDYRVEALSVVNPDNFNWLLSGVLPHADAKARLADVVEWLNAPAECFSHNGEVWQNSDPTNIPLGMAWLRKPTVYEFAKPIGYWRTQP